MENNHTAPPAWITHLRSRNFTTPVRLTPSHTALLHLYLRHFILSARRSPAHDNTRPSSPGPRNPRMPALIETRSATPVRRPWPWKMYELSRDRCRRPKSSELFGPPGLPGPYREGNVPAYQPPRVAARVELAYQVTPREFQNFGELFLSSYMLPRDFPPTHVPRSASPAIDGESPTHTRPVSRMSAGRESNVSLLGSPAL